MLTSTLTRPTTISPTTSCEAKVYLMETIDVAPIPEPKPRVISLEAINRRVKSKSGTRRRALISDTSQPSSESAGSTRSGRVGELSMVAEETDTPGSPAPSDVSFESQLSSGAGSGTEYGIRSVNTTDGTSSTALGSKTTLFKPKTITTTIEVLKGGFLRGDQIPIKITVKHTKHVRSLKGIIMTLYRQARVDMHPALPVAPNSKGDKTKSEDYFPKSKTGLGGLSLSSAGSSHLFRKDLSQSFAPLFVDPRTLTAEIKTAVRVPEEAFPTISNVPGAMISFRYFVEVVVDVQGKLSGLDRVLPASGLINVPAYAGTTSTGAADANSNLFSTWGGVFADTDSIRREKGVISCLFEVVIGTKDSERNGKQRKQAPESNYDAQDVHEFQLDSEGNAQHIEHNNPAYYQQDGYGSYYDQYGYDGAYDASWYDPAYHDTPQPSYAPPAEPQPEEELSEKERVRRAEARLLPSQPPTAAPSSASTSVHPGLAPSAPTFPDEEGPSSSYAIAGSSSSAQSPSHRQHAGSSEVSGTGPPSNSRDTTSQPSSAPSTIIAGDQPSNKPQTPFSSSSPAPRYVPSAAHVAPTDDKHELQRRRLELERSAPPEDDTDAAGPSQPPVRAMQDMSLFAPSAPVLEEEDEGIIGPVSARGSAEETGRGSGSALPPYER